MAGALAWLARRYPLSAWLAAAALTALALVCSVLPLELGGGAYVAERFLLFPLALLVLASAALTMALSRRPRRVDARPGRMGRIAAAAWLACGHLDGGRRADALARRVHPLELGCRSGATVSDGSQQLCAAADRPADPAGGLVTSERAVAADPASGGAWNHKGLALFHLRCYEEAREAFATATRVDPRAPLHWNNLAGALREQGRLEEAERLLRDEALRLDPWLPPAHLNLGVVYLRADRPDLAEAALRQAVRLLPPDQQPEAASLLADAEAPARWLRLADRLLASGDRRGALRALDGALARGAHEIDVQIGRSAVLLEARDWPEAERLLRSALGRWPADAPLYNNLASSHASGAIWRVPVACSVKPPGWRRAGLFRERTSHGSRPHGADGKRLHPARHAGSSLFS